MFDLQVIGFKIVKELSELIDNDVVVIDHNGFIIASTEPKRLNQFHEGSMIAMRKKEVVHMTKEMAASLKDVKEGMVMPLVIEGSSIGVIGVTGKPEEIEKYCKLVQRITQLFVVDFLQHQEQAREQRLFELFMIDLLNGNLHEALIIQRAEPLDLDMSLYDRIMIIQVGRRFELNEINELHHIQLIHSQLKIVQWSFDQLVVLVPKVTRDHLAQSLQVFLRNIEKIYKTDVLISVGNSHPFTQLSLSYQQALMALNSSVRDTKIIFQEDLKLELLLTSLPKEMALEYVHRTLGNLLHDHELLHNLECWLLSNGSLHDIAETLHIHKNTLKYRLKKIERMLNVDIYERIHQVELILAIQIHRRFQKDA